MLFLLVYSHTKDYYTLSNAFMGVSVIVKGVFVCLVVLAYWHLGHFLRDCKYFSNKIICLMSLEF